MYHSRSAEAINYATTVTPSAPSSTERHPAKGPAEICGHLAQKNVSEGLQLSLNDSGADGGETKKAPIIQGFDAICRLVSSLGFDMEIGEEGLEESVLSQKISQSHPHLAQLLAQLDVKSLWETIGDKERIRVFILFMQLLPSKD